MDIHVTSGPNPEGAVRKEMTGPITEDLPCRHCGYNLRGLSEIGACPECGTAIGRSLFSDQLRFSDPVWVRTLASGITWILYGIVLSILLGILSVVISSVIPNLDPRVMTAIGGVSSLVILVGYWKVTVPEPGVIEVSGIALHSYVRWTLVSGTVINLTAQSSAMLDPLIVGGITTVGGLIGLAGFFALSVYARRLALRVPDDSLAHQTRVVMWGMGISFGALMISAAIMAVTTSSAASPGPSFVSLVPMCMTGIAYFVFAIWSLVLVVRYKRAASAAAENAEQTWVQ